MVVKNLDQLIALVASATPLTKEAYPALGELTGERKVAFKIGHSLRHLSSSSGDMQKTIGDAEHGDPIDIALLRRKVFSASFSICKLCEILGISGKQLMEGVENLVEIEKAHK